MLALARSLVGQRCCIALVDQRQILEGVIRKVCGKTIKVWGVEGKVPICSVMSIVPVYADGGKR